MLIKKPSEIHPSQITSKANYLNRREFMRAGSIAGGLALAGPSLAAVVPDERRAKLENVGKSRFSTNEKMNSYLDITTYNNYWEFGAGKFDPGRNSFDFDDFIKPYDLEERIYRMRCVEAWSMVIPWVGISLAEIVKHHQPTSKAKFVAFTALHDPERMPGQRRGMLDWPYREGLTMAEATNPLTILAVGLYGEVLPNPNGAPIRLVTPWKYGFKGIKGIVKISFVEKQPRCSWQMAQPNEYGFYANVNPEVDHPRWSQATERRIGAGAFAPRIPTQMFNGYGEHVAHLYKGIDLRKYY